MQKNTPYPSRPLAVAIVMITAVLGACGSVSAADSARDAATAPIDPARGRLLYETTCDACHSQNVHWRDRHIVHNWRDLVAQVSRWQSNAGQRWEATDIRNVAAYLNENFYHLPCPAEECSGKQARLDRPESAR